MKREVRPKIYIGSGIYAKYTGIEGLIKRNDDLVDEMYNELPTFSIHVFHYDDETFTTWTDAVKQKYAPSEGATEPATTQATTKPATTSKHGVEQLQEAATKLAGERSIHFNLKQDANSAPQASMLSRLTTTPTDPAVGPTMSGPPSVRATARTDLSWDLQPKNLTDPLFDKDQQSLTSPPPATNGVFSIAKERVFQLGRC